MNRNALITVVAAFALGGAVGGAAGVYVLLSPPIVARHDPALASPHPVWKEVEWPFAMDQWGKGKAFHCSAVDCSVDVDLYIRAKIGFCNCKTGVADDDELARLSDFDLMGQKPVVLAPGHPITVAWMRGRSRPYSVAYFLRGERSALSVAFNDHCDAIVATVVIVDDRPTTIEPAVIEFLNSKTILNWAEVTLGL